MQVVSWMLGMWVLCGCVSLGWAGQFVTMRQDSQRRGYFDRIDSVTGTVTRHSGDAPVVFAWPYCEMTSDVANQRVFAVVFPDNSNNSVLYALNADLHAEQVYPNTDYWFFDLQYAPLQKSLYGIKVTSTYGRVLSHFALPADTSDPLQATELVAMPYMWYVNASTFDDVNSRYFALLNYFPGHPESTLAQKLVMAEVNGDLPPVATFLDVSASSGILQFISYSKNTGHLYFASMTNPGPSQSLISVGVLCPKTGEVKDVLTTLTAYWVGPMAVDDSAGVLTVFIRHSMGGAWTLYNVAMDRHAPARAVETFAADYFSVFDAVAKF